MSKKILITGGAGFIGSYISRKLIEMGHTPIILDIFAQYISPLDSTYVETRSSRFNDIIDKVVIERVNVENYSKVEKVGCQRFFFRKNYRLCGAVWCNSCPKKCLPPDCVA